MGLGVTGSDPSMSKPDQYIHYVPHTWVMNTNGDLYHGGSWTRGVCPRWHVSEGDTVSIQWSPPHVSVYHNNTQLHQWDVDLHGPVWMAGWIGYGNTVRMEDTGNILTCGEIWYNLIRLLMVKIYYGGGGGGGGGALW